MTKAKYTAEERLAVARESAREQMLTQWERQRQEAGQPLGYYGCHRRVRTRRGRAADQTCACGKQARHWAHIHDTDPADPQNYQAMCQSCHWAYDKVGARSAETSASQRSERARQMWARRSPETRREIMQKIADAGRRNQEPNALADSPDGMGLGN